MSTSLLCTLADRNIALFDSASCTPDTMHQMSFVFMRMPELR